MKKWHIAALVIVGLIVAGIAYSMYEKRKVGIKRRLSKGGESAILENHQRQKDNPSIMPGGHKVEPERPSLGRYLGRGIYDPTREGLQDTREKRKREEDAWGEFWDYL